MKLFKKAEINLTPFFMAMFFFCLMAIVDGIIVENKELKKEKQEQKPLVDNANHIFFTI